MARILHSAFLSVLLLWGFCCLAGSHWVGSGERVVAWTNGPPADRVRLGVRDEGVYRVAAGEIAAVSGASLSTVLSALSSGGLSLRCQGRAIAWAPGGDALLFYGVPTAELYAPENVYWLSFGAGAGLEPFDAAPEPGAATNAWFMHAEPYRSAFLAFSDYKDRRSSNATLTNVLNFGKWIAGSSTESVRAQERTVTLPGFCEGAATGCVARVSVASYYDFTAPDAHICELWLNGVLCGAQGWSGEQALTLDFAVPQGIVTNETVQLRIRNGLTAAASDFLLLEVSLVYPRQYCPANGLLLCSGGESGTLAAAGFGTPQVRVWDVTDPDGPLELAGAVAPDTNGLWRVAFLCGDAGSRYAVFDEAGGFFEPSVSGVRDTDWGDPAEMPELAIVIPPRRWIAGFDAAVQPLAELRAAQGLRARVIDAEELYNAFSDGLVHPAAFQKFCAAGATNGAAPALKYLLLAGHGGSDYKLDAFGFGEKGRFPSLFPLYLSAQVEGSLSRVALLPCDPVLGDIGGDAAPEVAVGRFLATNALELSHLVTKTIRYELTETWKNKGIFVACKQLYASDINFSNFVSGTASVFVNSGWAAVGLYPKLPPSDALSPLWNYNGISGASVELRKGSGLLYYFGHSSDTLLGTGASDPNCFVKSTTLQAGAWPFAPVALLVGCRIGRWTLLDPVAFQQSVAEAGARNPLSGFAAVVSPAGYMEEAEATGFSNGFRDAVGAGALRLGDAYRAGFAGVAPSAVANLRHMTLLGDPSLTIRAGVTARGTPSPWLIEQGLTNNPYADLEDPDGDGFATWMEVQAGTDYLRGGVSVRALGLCGASGQDSTLTFEAVAGRSYRVVSATNLQSGAWARVPWRPSAADEWSVSGIPVDWPTKTVSVPFVAGERQRFYKVQSDD